MQHELTEAVCVHPLCVVPQVMAPVAYGTIAQVMEQQFGGPSVFKERMAQRTELYGPLRDRSKEYVDSVLYKAKSRSQKQRRGSRLRPLLHAKRRVPSSSLARGTSSPPVLATQPLTPPLTPLAPEPKMRPSKEWEPEDLSELYSVHSKVGVVG